MQRSIRTWMDDLGRKNVVILPNIMDRRYTSATLSTLEWWLLFVDRVDEGRCSLSCSNNRSFTHIYGSIYWYVDSTMRGATTTTGTPLFFWYAYDLIPFIRLLLPTLAAVEFDEDVNK